MPRGSEPAPLHRGRHRATRPDHHVGRALRPVLKTLVVESLKASEGTAALRFHENSPIDRNELVKLATAEPHRFRLRPAGVFTMSLAARSWHEMVDEIERFLDKLASGCAPRTEKPRFGEQAHAPIH